MRYLSAHYVFPVSSPPLRNGIICVDDHGCIDRIIDTGGKLEECEKLEFYNGVLVPGFVNAHCHLELSHLHGVVEPNGGLPGFISSIGKLRGASDETILAAAKAADDEMRRNGTVAAGDISNNAGTLTVKRNSHIWYHTFVEIFGLGNSRAQEIFVSAQQVEREYRDAGMSVSIVPHAIYSVSQALWQNLYRSYKSSPSRVISMHHQESCEEMWPYPDGKGELAGMFRKNGLLARNPNGETLNEVKPEIGDIPQMMNCFREAANCLLVHNTFSSKDDLLKYTSDPGRFYFVLCPGSNLFIQNRLPSLQLFSSPELCRNICLGTDSLASNTKLSILEEIKIIHQHAPDIPLGMLLQWATLHGASALGCDDLYGSFEKGKAPGVNLITDIDFDRMQFTAKSAVKALVP
ncbi:MAG: amidohydrolase family protein [Bacteroidales bacterium]|jgi:cytosine/adenosine deaminase-related metal-dependent hydrolase|nr:amidohydrolase family protein [Bacteroidales bacterium]